LAYTLDESAVSLLYLASRLIELPLGVFAVAVTTVIFPSMARFVSSGDEDGFTASFNEGLRLILAISVPAGAGLIVLNYPILDSLFRYGAFMEADVMATRPLVWIYATGLPFYAMATFLVRGLHSRKDMKSPLRIAVLVLFLNLILSLLLMRIYGAAGLALANVVATAIQASLLFLALSRNTIRVSFRSVSPALGKIAIATLGLVVVCGAGKWAVGFFGGVGKAYSILQLLVFIPVGAAVYTAILSFLRYEELEILRRAFLQRMRPKGRNHSP
jgi:putative peptidoglycan lipid II flippase